MDRSIVAVLFGTFTLRFSTGLTGAMLAFYLADLHLPQHDGLPLDVLVELIFGPAENGRTQVTPFMFGVLTALFYATELVASPVFGLLSDKLGHHKVMQHGPFFGAVAVILTALTTNLPLLGFTRVLEGAATAASVPSILGYIAMATATDVALRGRVAARFELATIAGIGAGIGSGGIFWTLMGPAAFLLNAVFYFGSLAIYRWGVAAPDAPAGPHHRPTYGWSRYWKLIKSSHVWILAPTWIAINAALGLYTTQTLFNLVREPDPRFAHLFFGRGFSALEVTAGFIIVGVVFFAGLIYWGDRFRKYRRTTIIFYGILGGAVLVAATIAFNHATDFPLPVQIALLIPATAGLFVLAGATPAALGLLADISEAFPDDRGAIMGLYSVFLALGQIFGALIGGVAVEWLGFDGILIATLVLMGVALPPLFQLRLFEHRFEPETGVPQPSEAVLGEEYEGP
ncbi:MAG TPA: MFS transporter [Candidatus Limnocylindria bacterium]|nr:MFS transporter [Candidatus Limnocylindria bacterium]